VTNEKKANFNLSDCSKIISKQTGLSDSKALSALKSINQTILSQLVFGSNLEIRNFGSLKKKSIRPRKFTNPKTKELSFLGETYTIYFKQSKTFFDAE
jgi:nucleoid DNA-binding protein